MAWPKTWPVGIFHRSVFYFFHGNVSNYEGGLRHFLDTNLRVEKSAMAINIGLTTSNDLYTCF